MEPENGLIMGGLGYIGSLLTGVILCQGYKVTVLDKLFFGGDLRDNRVSFDKIRQTLGLEP
jgi:UDP-glucose 4-epimerase